MHFDLMNLFVKSPAMGASALGLLLILAGGGLAGSAQNSVNNGASWSDDVSIGGPQIRVGGTSNYGNKRSYRRQGTIVASTNLDHWNYGTWAAGVGAFFILGAGGLTAAVQLTSEEREQAL